MNAYDAARNYAHIVIDTEANPSEDDFKESGLANNVDPS
jgi:hypothetical protein